jgi:hypothetical protein
MSGQPARYYGLPDGILPVPNGQITLNAQGGFGVYVDDSKLYQVVIYGSTPGVVMLTDLNIEVDSASASNGLTAAQVEAGGVGLVAYNANGGLLGATGVGFTGDVLYPPKILGVRGQNSSVTGTTSKTLLWSQLIPAGSIGPNSVIELTPVWSFSNTTNVKTFEIAIGPSPSSLTFSWVRNRSAAGTVSEAPLIHLRCKGSLTMQDEVYSNNYYVNGTLAPVARSIDFTADQYVYVFGTLANAADMITLNSVVVRTIA